MAQGKTITIFMLIPPFKTTPTVHYQPVETLIMTEVEVADRFLLLLVLWDVIIKMSSYQPYIFRIILYLPILLI